MKLWSSIALVSVLLSSQTKAQEVTLDGVPRTWKVDRVELSSAPEFACVSDLRVFSEDDFNQAFLASFLSLQPHSPSIPSSIQLLSA